MKRIITALALFSAVSLASAQGSQNGPVSVAHLYGWCNAEAGSTARFGCVFYVSGALDMAREVIACPSPSLKLATIIYDIVMPQAKAVIEAGHGESTRADYLLTQVFSAVLPCERQQPEPGRQPQGQMERQNPRSGRWS